MTEHVKYLNNLLLKLDELVPVVTNGEVQSEFSKFYPKKPDVDLFDVIKVVQEFTDVQKDLTGNIFQMSIISQLCTKFLYEYNSTLEEFAKIGTSVTDRLIQRTDKMLKSIAEDATFDDIYDKMKAFMDEPVD